MQLNSILMWKVSRVPKVPPIRKFIENCGGRRVGDRIAYVTDPALLADGEDDKVGWLEDKAFEEKSALRDWPGLKSLFDRARRNGIALCIKG